MRCECGCGYEGPSLGPAEWLISEAGDLYLDLLEAREHRIAMQNAETKAAQDRVRLQTEMRRREEARRG